MNPVELVKLHGCFRTHLVRDGDLFHTLCNLILLYRWQSPLARGNPEREAGRYFPHRPRGQAYRVTGTVSACTCVRCLDSWSKGRQVARLWRQSDPQYRRPAS